MLRKTWPSPIHPIGGGPVVDTRPSTDSRLPTLDSLRIILALGAEDLSSTPAPPQSGGNQHDLNPSNLRPTPPDPRARPGRLRRVGRTERAGHNRDDGP